MRTEFDEQLGQLHGQLVRMGSLCEQAIAHAAGTLTGAPAGEGAAAAQLELEIDHLERDAEASCMRLLLLQQPVASDLRAVSAALRMISDLERIGDQAADIAELTPYLDADADRLPLQQMAAATVEMVRGSVRAFVAGDDALARTVIAADDRVDALFDAVKRDLLTLIQQKGIGAEPALDTLMAAKYFERIGDHAVNVAEWVVYAVTGIHESSEHHAALPQP